MSEGLLVLTSAEYTFTDDFYNQATRNKPLRDDLSLGQLDKYTYTHHDRLYVAETGDLLFDVKVIMLNKIGLRISDR